ncbi:hypothetical protein LXL04_009177 [Taraxacum kok-saghyz]
MASSKGPDPVSNLKPQPSTTFVQADPSNFRAVVQKLTGDTTHKLRNSTPFRHAGKPTVTEVVRGRSGYKLQERRKTGKKLEITLGKVSQVGEMVEASPVSTLAVCGRGSPGTPVEGEEEEEKAIAEKGFYLHPSPLKPTS